MLVNGDRYIFADWSDSSLAHPFFTMVVTIRARPTAWAWMQAALRCGGCVTPTWSPGTFASRPQLLDALVSPPLGMLNRALSWHHGTGALPLRLKEEDADAVPEWLQDFLRARSRS